MVDTEDPGEERTMDDSSSAIFIGACAGGLVAILVVVIFFVVSASRKPADVFKTKPKNLRPLVTSIPYGEAINRLLGQAPSQGYKIEEVVPDGSRVILSTPITLFSYGFFYPVYFSVQPDRSTLVEVGIASRAFQWGPVVTHNHDKCFKMVAQAVLPYAVPMQTQVPPPYPVYPQQPAPPSYSPQAQAPYPPYSTPPPPQYPSYPGQPPGSGPQNNQQR